MDEEYNHSHSHHHSDSSSHHHHHHHHHSHRKKSHDPYLLEISDEPLTYPTTSLSLEKTTPYATTKSLADAQFEVKFYAGATSASGTPTRTWVIKSLKDGSNYKVKFDKDHYISGDSLYTDNNGDYVLPLGFYTIEEIVPPEGYQLSEDIVTYTITDSNGSAKLVTEGSTVMKQEPVISDEPIWGGIEIEKRDIETEDGQPQGDATLEGAVYSIINMNDYDVVLKTDENTGYGPGEEVLRITTDENGHAESGIILQYGSYKVVEVEPPTGYTSEGENTVFEFTIENNDEVFEYTVKNRVIRFDIQLIKFRDTLSSEEATDDVEPIEGVTFGIYLKRTDELILTITTDEEGVATTADPENYPYEVGFDHHLISSTVALDKFVSQYRNETKFDPALELIGTEKEPCPFPYRYSYNSAELKDELPEYLWSFGLNKKCAKEIDEVIMDPGGHDFSDVLTTFGPERSAYVLAATVEIFKNNGSISNENKSWMDDFGYLPAESSVLESDEYLLKASPSSLNSFLDENLPTLKRCMSVPRVKERKVLNGNTEPGSYQYAIYQIDSNQCDYHFEGRDYLLENNIHVNPYDYKFVYSGTERPMRTERDALDDIFYKFNAKRPDDFRGYSLSVSDVVVLNHDYRQKAYYIDKTGYMALPDFVQGRRDILDNPFFEPDYNEPKLSGPSR